MTEPPTYVSQQLTVSRFSRVDFVADADLTKKVWEIASRIIFDTSYRPGERFPEARTEVASLWSNTYLYFAFWSKYTELYTYAGEEVSQERWGLWERDVVEVFINPFPDRMNTYFELEVAPNNQWVDLAIDLEKTPFYDMSWDSGFDHVTRVDELNGTWYCEMRIPLVSLGVKQINSGAEWRINFYRCDGTRHPKRRRSLAWSPTTVESFHTPSCFGIIRFEE